VVGLEPHKFLEEVEWSTLVFFMGLFVMVGALVEVGIVGRLGGAITSAVGDSTPGAQALWWALALGADLCGNATAVGASANVVRLGIAARHGHPISFWHFTRYGLVVATVTITVAWGYLWLRYYAA